MKLFDHPAYRAFSWVLLFAYMGLIFYMSSQSTLPIPMRFPYEDKVLHFLAYNLLAFLAAHAVSQGTHKRRFWVAFAVASLYGISDEVHQYFVPGRDCSAVDWLADSFGAWMGAYLYLKSEAVWRKS